MDRTEPNGGPTAGGDAGTTEGVVPREVPDATPREAAGGLRAEWEVPMADVGKDTDGLPVGHVHFTSFRGNVYPCGGFAIATGEGRQLSNYL